MTDAARLSTLDELHALRAAALDWRLSRGDLGVYAVLLKHSDGNGLTFPGPALISRSAKLAVPNVKVSIAKLASLQYLSIKRRGLRRANHYHLQDSPAVPPRPAIGNSSITNKARPPDTNDSDHWDGTHTQFVESDSEATRHAGVPELGMPALTNWVCQRDANSLVNSQKNSQVDLEEFEEQKRLQEQEHLQKQEHRHSLELKQRASLLTEYRQSLETHPKNAAHMAKHWPWLLTSIDDAA